MTIQIFSDYVAWGVCNELKLKLFSAFCFHQIGSYEYRAHFSMYNNNKTILIPGYMMFSLFEESITYIYILKANMNHSVWIYRAKQFYAVARMYADT